LTAERPGDHGPDDVQRLGQRETKFRFAINISIEGRSSDVFSTWNFEGDFHEGFD